MDVDRILQTFNENHVRYILIGGMSQPMTLEKKQLEEEKRERNWDPLTRWNALQATITWAEAQRTVQRNTRSSRLEEQARKLAQ